MAAARARVDAGPFPALPWVAVAGGGKEHAATATAAAAEGGAADGPEVQATAAPAQQAAYISRVARARQANAARRKGSA